MRFAAMAAGVSREQRVRFTYMGQPIDTLVRALTAGEEMDVIEKSADACRKRKVSDPRPGHPLYEAQVQAQTLLLACIDPDSPIDKREPTFASVNEILQLDMDTIVVLFESQRIWQEETSPSVRTKTADELFKLGKEVADSGDPFDYVRGSPGTRWKLTHFLACLAVDSPAFKEWSSRTYSASTSSESEAAKTTGTGSTTSSPPALEH